MLHRLHCYIFQSLFYSAAIKKAMAHVLTWFQNTYQISQHSSSVCVKDLQYI